MDERINEVVGLLNPDGRSQLLSRLDGGQLSWLADALGADLFGEFAARVRRGDLLGAQALLDQEQLLAPGLVAPRDTTAARRRVGAWLWMVPFLALLAFAALALRGCDEDNDNGGGTTLEVGGTRLLDVVNDNPQLSTFATLVDDAELGEKLRIEGPFTVFAPTNDAFADLPGGLDGLRADPERLATILTNHMVGGNLPRDRLTSGTYTTLAGNPLDITVDGATVHVGDATVTGPDQRSLNGVVHAIDGLLLPEGISLGTAATTTTAATAKATTTTAPTATTSVPVTSSVPATTTTTAAATTTTVPAVPRNVVDVLAATGQFKTLTDLLGKAGLNTTLSGPGPFTIFAPDDTAFAGVPKATLDAIAAKPDALGKLLTYHVVAGQLAAATAQPGVIGTLNGEAVTLAFDGPVLRVNSVAVTRPDIAAPNGVVHGVNGLLLPANLDLGGQAKRFSVFFDVDVDTPNAASQPTVDQAFAAARAAKPGTTVILTGYADVRGDPASNLALSKSRADNVAAILASGAPSLSYLVNAKGDTQPGADLDQSRRVDIVIF